MYIVQNQFSSFVGRQAEQEILIKSLNSLDNGVEEGFIEASPGVASDRKFRSGFVAVTGDPGIGKSALLDEFARVAKSEGALVLTGRGGGHGDDDPYRAFADFLGAGDPPNEHIAGNPPGGHAAGALPGDRGALAPVHDGYPAARELLGRVAAASKPARLVLILDDSDATDPNLTALLASLLRQPPAVAVLFVVAYRRLPTVLQSAIAGRSGRVSVDHIHLGPLSVDDVEVMLAGQASTIWRQTLLRESEGNPAYLKALVAEQTLPDSPSGLDHVNLLGFGGRCPTGSDSHYSPNSAAGCRSVRGEHGEFLNEHTTFLRELSSADDAVVTVAEAAAVLGTEFDAELVAQVLDQPESAVLDAISELMRRDVVRITGSGGLFAFRHAVVRRAVYHGTKLSKRVRLHARADGVLAVRGASVVERAPHLEQSARYGDLAAVELLDSAAAAVATTDPHAVAVWLATARRLLPADAQFQAQGSRILVRLARAEAACGHLHHCRGLMHEALRTMPRQPRADHAEAVAFTAMVSRQLGARAETDAVLRAEIETLRDTDDVATAVLKYELASGELHRGNTPECCRWAQQALATALQRGNRCLQVSSLGVLAKANAVEGHTATAERYLNEATKILDAMLDDEFAASLDAVTWIGWSEILLRHWDEALAHLDKAVEIAARSGCRLTLPQLLVCYVYELRTRGRLAEAETVAEHAVYLADQSDSPEERVIAYSMQSWVDATTGRLDRAKDSDVMAIGQVKHAIGGWCQVLAMRLLAEARLLSGDHEGCLALVPAIGGADLPAASRHSRVMWYELLTRAELAAGRPDAAAKWAESASAVAATVMLPTRAALAMLARAQVQLIQEPQSALGTAVQAAAGLAADGMTLDELRARVVVGAALWHYDRYDDAMQELETAQLALEQIGATTLARLTRTERNRTAGRVSRSKHDGHGGMTGRERQIAELVREGLTNRVIARRLHISEKTVEMHLSNLFAKLGVPNRAALAALVTRQRLSRTCPTDHNGMLLCFLGQAGMRLVRNARMALVTARRVSDGAIMSSMHPRSAAMYGLVST
jgi:DNA-binding CsgD family transcriptional regulator/tetratricopeptide (TPR) repeat protein